MKSFTCLLDQIKEIIFGFVNETSKRD